MPHKDDGSGTERPRIKSIKLETLKANLDIGQKLSVLGGFAIFTLHCFAVGRLPDIQLPSLALLFGASFGYFVILLFAIGASGLFPAFFILNMLSLRRKRRVRKDRKLLPTMTLTITEAAAFGGVFWSRSAQWMILLTVGVICVFVPIVLTVLTRSFWVRFSISQAIHTEDAVESPADWISVLLAFFFWACCSLVFFLFLIIVAVETFRGINLDLFLFLAVIIALLANVFVEALTYNSASEIWIAGSVAIGLIVFLLLLLAGLPKLVYGPLGVGYIHCESGSVLVDKPAADKILFVLPDAIDSKQPMPVAIKKYEVEIVSRIGKEALLELTFPEDRSQMKRVFVPTESIIDYRTRPDALSFVTVAR
jgi:hypothetical protein